MDREELQKTLKKLHYELKNIHSVDERGRELLETLMKDIQLVLDQQNKDRAREHLSLLEGLKDTVNYLEESHPTLVLSMKQVIETLSNMGI